MAQAGAKGTDEGALLGFGVHFGVKVTQAQDAYTCDTIRAFALLKDWLRRIDPIDRARRLLPLVQPWPRAFVDAIMQTADGPDFDKMRTLYAEHAVSRNHALDLLPLVKDADTAQFDPLFPDAQSTKAHPAFHFRLPDCRIDDPAWSLAREWERKALVEEVADRPDVLEALRKDYNARPPKVLADRFAWAEATAECLSAHGIQSVFGDD